MTELPSDLAGQPGAANPPKPALAPGVKSQVMSPNAAQPTGPGLAAGPATFNPAVKPPLAAPKPRLRAVEPPPASVAASYKVSVAEPTQSAETIPVSHVIASGIAAVVALAAAFMIFLKY